MWATISFRTSLFSRPRLVRVSRTPVVMSNSSVIIIPCVFANPSLKHHMTDMLSLSYPINDVDALHQPAPKQAKSPSRLGAVM
jgi:hypothetical protein